ncbi:MAG: T9SS type A sorting domain-containing protein [Bacteroidales bacterium]|nr:T9SS type A sorting domain-containing protein [Bacteroidales bacterium]
MKTFTILTLITALIFTGLTQAVHSNPFNGTPDSVAMGPGYGNDIYYSFEDGVVASVSRTNWDIGFHTTLWTATIITNGAAGVNLYTYPNADTTGWNMVDTIGMGGWPIMYDNEDSWEDGAFTRHATGHPDYGWGKYNPITHDVVGDSIYLLKTLDGTYKKIWIQRKNSSANTYYIRQANLDGSDDHVVTLNINPYTSKNFVYYAFSTDSFVEREPDTASWDILFTKYMAIQPNGTPYPVVGVLNNFEVYGNEFYPVAPNFSDYASMPFDSTKSPIGWEWKTFDMNTFTWTVADSTAFFVHTRKDNVYKLVFTKFEGSTTGNIVFSKEPLSAGIFDQDIKSELTVYPNPVSDHLTIDFGRQVNGMADISIFDMTGRLIYSSEKEIIGHKLSVRLPETSSVKGLHLMKVGTEIGTFSSKFMVY